MIDRAPTITVRGVPTRYRRAVDFDLTSPRPGAVAVAAVFAVCAIYLLFLRNSVMWGFLCIIGIVVVGIIMVSPDFLSNR